MAKTPDPNRVAYTADGVQWRGRWFPQEDGTLKLVATATRTSACKPERFEEFVRLTAPSTAPDGWTMTDAQVQHETTPVKSRGKVREELTDVVARCTATATKTGEE